jgi:hypothetical protein
MLIVPCGQLLEGKWQMEDNRVAVRFIICAVAALGGSSLAEFRASLIFVGCACVGMVRSFCVPPVLHREWRCRLPARWTGRVTVVPCGCIHVGVGRDYVIISTYYNYLIWVCIAPYLAYNI